MPGPARIAGIRFLNARPLLAGLEAGIAAPFRYQLTPGDPASCARSLGGGDAVAALVPVVALPGLESAWPLAELGIASRKEVTSVLLVSKVPLAQVRSLAAHRASRTSVILARLLLSQRWGADPIVVSSSPPLGDMLEEADAAVIIGDPALEIRGRTDFLEVDLAAAWVEWTGKPFVFAVWAIAAGAPQGTADLLRESYAFSRRSWDELIPRWARQHRLKEDQARRYLEHNLTFALGAAEADGMAHFLGLVREHGLLAS